MSCPIQNEIVLALNGHGSFYFTKTVCYKNVKNSKEIKFKPYATYFPSNYKP